MPLALNESKTEHSYQRRRRKEEEAVNSWCQNMSQETPLYTPDPDHIPTAAKQRHVNNRVSSGFSRVLRCTDWERSCSWLDSCSHPARTRTRSSESDCTVLADRMLKDTKNSLFSLFTYALVTMDNTYADTLLCECIVHSGRWERKADTCTSRCDTLRSERTGE